MRKYTKKFVDPIINFIKTNPHVKIGEVANKFNLTKSQLKTALYTVNTNYLEIRNELIFEDYFIHKMTFAQLSQKYKLGVATINQMFLRRGIRSFKKKRHLRSFREKCIELSFDLKQLSYHYGLSKDRISELIREKGLVELGYNYNSRMKPNNGVIYRIFDLFENREVILPKDGKKTEFYKKVAVLVDCSVDTARKSIATYNKLIKKGFKMKTIVYKKDRRYTMKPNVSRVKMGYGSEADLEYWDVFFEGKKKGTATNFEAAIKCLYTITGEKERIDIENDLEELLKDTK